MTVLHAFSHQGFEGLGAHVNQLLVVARLEVDVRKTRQRVVVDRGNPIGRPERRHRALLAILEEIGHLRLGRELEIAIQLPAEALEPPSELEALEALLASRREVAAGGLWGSSQALVLAALAFWQLPWLLQLLGASGETLDYGPCAFMDRFDPSIT